MVKTLWWAGVGGVTGDGAESADDTSLSLEDEESSELARDGTRLMTRGERIVSYDGGWRAMSDSW